MKRPLDTMNVRPSVDPSCPAPQSLRDEGKGSTLVLHSPYGTQQQRNGTYGWGNPFQIPRGAHLDHLPNIRIGVSSLNGVPGSKDRSMPTLLSLYRRKFNCLEHCYPYHRVGEASAWASWAAMVRDSNAVSGALSAAATEAESEENKTASPIPVVQANRFLYTVKANESLTHEKQALLDRDLEAHIDLFFTQRCCLLEPFMGPILLQFPPFFEFSSMHLKRLEALAARLPADEVVYRVHYSRCAGGGSAAEADMDGGEKVTRRRRVRIAVEFRNRSWYCQETFVLLRRLGWALVVAHHHNEATFQTHVDTGVDFMYVRLHGPLGKNVGDYGRVNMRHWAEQVVKFVKQQPAALPENDAALKRGNIASSGVDLTKEVYIFLNNSDSQVGGTTSSTVDATCLAEEIARLLPPPPQARPAPPVSSENPRLSKAGTSPPLETVESTEEAFVVASDSDKAMQSGLVSPDDRQLTRQRQETIESIFDVDSASSGTVIIE